LGTDPISVEPYISRAYFEKERQRIFRKVWLNVGRVEQISNRGDYFVKELAVCNTSIVVVRAEGGKVHAFHNMCSHRGNQVVWNSKGKCNAFVCGFHNWTYGLDGALRHVRDEDNFFNLQKKNLGLTPVSLDIWEGFIFVNLDQNPKETVKEYLGDVGRSFEGYPFDELATSCFSWEIEVNANWKLIKDAFQEVFHIPSLHHRSTGSSFTDEVKNPHFHVHEIAISGPHSRNSLPSNPNWQSTPVEALANRFGILMLQKQNADPTQGMPDGVNATRNRDWSFSGFMCFPNSVFYLSQGSFLSHHMWPLAENRTLWESRIYLPKAKTLAQRFNREYGRVTMFDGVLVEDGSVVEKVQSMLASGAKKEIMLADEEVLIRHHHKVTEEYFNEQEG